MDFRQSCAARLHDLSLKLWDQVGEHALQVDSTRVEIEADLDALRLAHNEIKDRNEQLDKQKSIIDTKATSLLGFVSAAALFLASKEAPGCWKIAPFATLALAGFFSFQAMKVRWHSGFPKPRTLVDQVNEFNGDQKEELLLKVLIAGRVESYEKNIIVRGCKAKNWRRGLLFLALSIFLTVVALIMGAR